MEDQVKAQAVQELVERWGISYEEALTLLEQMANQIGQPVNRNIEGELFTSSAGRDDGNKRLDKDRHKYN